MFAGGCLDPFANDVFLAKSAAESQGDSAREIGPAELVRLGDDRCRLVGRHGLAPSLWRREFGFAEDLAQLRQAGLRRPLPYFRAILSICSAQ